jgi:sulfite reductase (NADPH) hemoprotein beta-component
MTWALSPFSTMPANCSGWNVTVGGGMGMTHGESETFPRTADVMLFCEPEDALAVSEAVVTTQRDWGNRENRKRARLKYTIDARGLDWFVAEVTRRQGFELAPPRPFEFTSTGDRFGWTEGHDGRWHLTLRIEAGRVADTAEAKKLTGLREIARVHRGDFRLHAQPEPDRRQRRALRTPVHRRAGGPLRARRARALDAGAP